ncbi:HTH domain-containing protein [Companilactobacillus paralimentarius]|uniref:HTH domain-containing protein n=1 Tax=Companilactobacillus paralimentarius TaxID=83526 RepID=UPI0028536493|nr:HTH domain-containing protein [Companilactobacillus paralimentarius]MDR4932328.1 HTH domain-containing protein [Companilactobacillus paralimentarius]
MNTSERRFAIYIKLLDNQILNKNDLAHEYNVTPRAIQRDISQINLTFEDICLPYRIEYERNNFGYRMHSDQHILNTQEILVLIKILLAENYKNKLATCPKNKYEIYQCQKSAFLNSTETSE